nr:unnamed protein product [Spirometra erinaceieuropaei]
MEDTCLSKQLFYGGVLTGTRRQGGQRGRYRDTLENPLKRLQINPEICEDLAQNRPVWRREAKTGAAIYKANRIVYSKAKREAHDSAGRNRGCDTAHLRLFLFLSSSASPLLLLLPRNGPQSPPETVS